MRLHYLVSIHAPRCPMGRLTSVPWRTAGHKLACVQSCHRQAGRDTSGLCSLSGPAMLAGTRLSHSRDGNAPSLCTVSCSLHLRLKAMSICACPSSQACRRFWDHANLSARCADPGKAHVMLVLRPSRLMAQEVIPDKLSTACADPGACGRGIAEAQDG